MGKPLSSTAHTRLTARQEAVLRAYVDALLPPFLDASHVVDSSAGRYWEYQLSNDPFYMDAVVKTIRCKLPTFDRFSILMLLNLMDTIIGTCLLFNICRNRRFVEYTSQDRSNILLPSLQYSRTVLLRKIFQSFKKLLCGIAFTYHGQNAEYVNPFWQAMGYPGSPASWLSSEIDSALLKKATEQQKPLIEELKRSKQHVLQSNNPLELHCDVLIVGSGSGGSVAAKVLASAGYDVIVLEKGSYRSPVDISLHEIHAMEQQYEQSGLLQNTTGTIMILAGSALGGGAAINWACCLPLPQFVREEWTNEHKLHASLGREYDESLQYILDSLGIRTKNAACSSKAELSHNKMNRKLQEGCNFCGYEWEETGQSLRDVKDSASGYIGMGDRYGNKNGAVQIFLVDAVCCGARIFESCHVDKIIITATPSGRRATGVECTVSFDDCDSRQLVIRARRSVILAAGALHTPCILKKSGLGNPHIGNHLRLHPVTGVMGFYPSDEPIHSIHGAPMTTVCNQFANGPQNNGYGAKIECPCSYPGLLAAASPWISARLFRERMLKYSHCVPLIALQRDSGNGGSIRQSMDGQSLVIDYILHPNDATSLLAAMQGAAEILVGSGAQEVATGHIYDTGYKVTDDARSSKVPALQKYLSSIEQRGVRDHEIGLFSAHQMGTCRMSASPQQGPVDENGETWECDDLYIMDASLFPTASGANPMVTVLTLSHMLSTRLSLMLKLRDHLLDKTTKATSQVYRLTEKERAMALELSRRRTWIRSQHASGMTDGLVYFLKIALILLLLPLLLAYYWIVQQQQQRIERKTE